ELHLSAHGAGSLLLAPMVPLLTARGQIKSGSLAGAPGYGLHITSCCLSAPACTTAAFHEDYAPALASGAMRHLILWQIDQRAERRDRWTDLYGRSFLQLVANALECRPRVPGMREGTPLLGLASATRFDGEVQQLVAETRMSVVPQSDEREPAAMPLAGIART